MLTIEATDIHSQTFFQTRFMVLWWFLRFFEQVIFADCLRAVLHDGICVSTEEVSTVQHEKLHLLQKGIQTTGRHEDKKTNARAQRPFPIFLISWWDQSSHPGSLILHQVSLLLHEQLLARFPSSPSVEHLTLLLSNFPLYYWKTAPDCAVWSGALQRKHPASQEWWAWSYPVGCRAIALMLRLFSKMLAGIHGSGNEQRSSKTNGLSIWITRAFCGHPNSCTREGIPPLEGVCRPQPARQ